MHLPEHEHDDLQVGLHFTAPRGRSRIGLGEEPSFFTLIPSRKPHVGRWEDGSEVVVLLLGPSQMEQAAERPVRLNREISGTACSVDPMIQAIGATLRREFYTGAVADRQYLEAIGTVLSGHLIRRWTTGSVTSTGRGRLSSAQLRKTIDLVEGAPPEGFKYCGPCEAARHGRTSIHPALPPINRVDSLPVPAERAPGSGQNPAGKDQLADCGTGLGTRLRQSEPFHINVS
jgi:hypothetical protein